MGRAKNDILIAIVVKKIRKGKINPVTGQAFKVQDIKKAAIKTGVENKLGVV
jgi:hypothetical protein